MVTKYVGLAVAAGLNWKALEAMDEATLERRLLASPRPSDTYAQADYGRIHQELARKGVTLMLLWEEYRNGITHAMGSAVNPRYIQAQARYSSFNTTARPPSPHLYLQSTRLPEFLASH